MQHRIAIYLRCCRFLQPRQIRPYHLDWSQSEPHLVQCGNTKNFAIRHGLMHVHLFVHFNVIQAAHPGGMFSILQPSKVEPFLAYSRSFCRFKQEISGPRSRQFLMKVSFWLSGEIAAIAQRGPAKIL